MSISILFQQREWMFAAMMEQGEQAQRAVAGLLHHQQEADLQQVMRTYCAAAKLYLETTPR